MAQLKARHGFSGPDGDHKKDDIFEADDARVEFLISGGYAEAVPPLPADPQEPAQAGKSATPKTEQSAQLTTSKGKS